MRPTLIAECCQNHNGDRELLTRMIHAAAENGADYVKIQAIRSSELTQRHRFEEGVVDEQGVRRVIKRPFARERERLAKLDLSLDDEAWFVDECRRAGVASMTTIFTRAAAAEVGALGYHAVKVASYDCPSFPLLRDLRRHWSTFVVSTGACFDSEIERAVDVLSGVDLTLLHCVTIYPTPMNEFHLRRMGWLRRFAPKVGLSDHSRVSQDGVWASKIALALGANTIERHFTVLEPSDTKDGPVSIRPSGLRELRDMADRPRRERMDIVNSEYPEWQVCLGTAQRPLSHAELLNRDYYRGRFASKVAGQVIYNWEDVDMAALRETRAGGG